MWENLRIFKRFISFTLNELSLEFLSLYDFRVVFVELSTFAKQTRASIAHGKPLKSSVSRLFELPLHWGSLIEKKPRRLFICMPAWISIINVSQWGSMRSPNETYVTEETFPMVNGLLNGKNAKKKSAILIHTLRRSSSHISRHQKLLSTDLF